MRLHLGCGNRYLEGYVNVDYPAEKHTVQAGLKADKSCDLIRLEYPTQSIEEIRLHHVFEHFPRATALALLCRWRDWLTPKGILWIETPDLLASCWMLISPFVSYKSKQEVIRHLFGSHEAHWAVHWDGWYAARYKETFAKLGFENLRFTRAKWGRLRNIEIVATRGEKNYSVDEYRRAVRALLTLSTIKMPKVSGGKTALSELAVLEVWMREWERIYIGHH